MTRVRILHVQDCPNVAMLQERLVTVLGGRDDIIDVFGGKKK